MAEIIEIGKISARGQIAIPLDIRKKLNLKEGERVIFFAEGDTLLVKKVEHKTFAEITKPLKKAAERAGLKEKEVPGIVKRFRESKK